MVSLVFLVADTLAVGGARSGHTCRGKGQEKGSGHRFSPQTEARVSAEPGGSGPSALGWRSGAELGGGLKVGSEAWTT